MNLQTAKTHRWQIPHPAVFILLWLVLVVALQSLAGAVLLLAGALLLLLAYSLSSERLHILLHRTRWMMLSLLLIYSYATPGVAVWASLAQFSPTYEGVFDGLLQLSRLVFALAGLVVLQSSLSQPQLISGLYALSYPLRYLGLSRTRVAVRLALTLHYVESSLHDTAVHWRTRIERMLVQEEIKQQSIELQLMPLKVGDGLLLICGFCLLLLVLI